MKTLTLPLHQLHSPQEVLAMLAKENLRKGDRLDVVVTEKNDENDWAFWGMLLLLGVVLLAYFGAQQEKKKRVEEGDALLKNIFREGDTAALEKNLEAEYGIEIEWVNAPNSVAEEADEAAAWDQAATALLADAYGEEEPDYSDVPLLEPNPNYKP